MHTQKIKSASHSIEKYQNYIHVFAKDAEPFRLTGIRSDEIHNINPQPADGYIIPYQPGKLIYLIFKSDRETTEIPFKIPIINEDEK